MVVLMVALSFAFFIGLHLVLRWNHQRRAERLGAGARLWANPGFTAGLGVLMQDGGEPIGKQDKPEAAAAEKKEA